MLILNTALNNLDILSLQTGTKIGQLSAPILEPNELKIVALYCKGPTLDKNSILHTDDIREYSPNGVIIDTIENIMPLTADLVRLQETLALRFSLLNKVVIDDHKQKLGKIENYAVDNQTFEIMQFRVLQNPLKNLNGASLLINRQQIIEVTDHRVVVKAPDVPIESGRRSWVPQFLSPRRAVNQSPSSQPDAE